MGILARNNLVKGGDYGIFSWMSLDSLIIGNKIENCSSIGILSRGGCDVINNTITSCYADEGRGIQIQEWDKNTILGNTVKYCRVGIWLRGFSHGADRNNIALNTISFNDEGVKITDSDHNLFYHNNFANNTSQVSVKNANNTLWDDGYPNGGNYWSDSNGTDLYHGPDQNISGGDGIGDTPYIVDENNKDRYPLMKPYSGAYDIGITNLTTSKTVVGQGYTINLTTETLNYGINTETFNVTTYANTTMITRTQITLESRTSTTLTIPWNTKGVAKGNYTIIANVTILPSETDIGDNILTDGWVFITIQGDVNGDRMVDLKDVFGVALAYGSHPGYPMWDPNLDINSDNNVDLKDYLTTCLNYGESW